MVKNSLTNYAFERKQIHIENVGSVDFLKIPAMYGITSDQALNGKTKFDILVTPLDAICKTFMQLQLAPGGVSPVVAHRTFDGTEYGEWIGYFEGLDSQAMVGQSVFDEDSGKPIWLKTANTPVFEVDKLTIVAVNTPEVCTLTLGAATTSGTITITLNGAAVEVEVVEGDTSIAVSEAVYASAALFVGWSLTQDNDMVTFIKNSAGANTTPVFADTDSTGVTGVFQVTTAGVGVKAGTISITLEGEVYEIEIEALATPEEIAAAIAETIFEGWAANVVGSEVANTELVQFNRTTPGVVALPEFADTDTTGISGEFEQTVAGIRNVWVDGVGTVVYQ